MRHRVAEDRVIDLVGPGRGLIAAPAQDHVGHERVSQLFW
jgi:hypothetical protein